jgi:hypothetical protein
MWRRNGIDRKPRRKAGELGDKLHYGNPGRNKQIIFVNSYFH